MIKLFVVLCSLSSPDICMQRLVTNSDLADLSMSGCMVGVPQLAEWLKQYPGYRLARWSCQVGDRPERSAT